MIEELWDQVPAWLKWVVWLGFWAWLGLRRLWRGLPDNLIVFGLRMKRGGGRNYIGTKSNPWVVWGDVSVMKDDDANS